MAARRPPWVGPYVIERPLGVGGMGEVLQGRHQALDRHVAIKLRRRTRGREEERLAERFRHTACLQGELDHPSIARVYDYLELPDHQALVLEYLGGGSVAELIAVGPCPVDATVEMGIRAAEALHFAHARGVVHRDIKPDNLMLVDRDRPDTLRVCDFGVAKTADRSPDLTLAGANVGTVWYMSPEQFNHEDPTPGFDIYSLGATLYEMLTGHIPFARNETAEIFRRFLDGEPAPPILSRNPRVPPAVATVVEAAMAVDVEQRVPTASALALLLRAVAEQARLGLDDAAARRLFRAADGAGLRRALRRLEQSPPGQAVAQAVVALDVRLNGATAITRIDLPAIGAGSTASINLTASLDQGQILAAMLDEDDGFEEEDDHTLVMSGPLLSED